MRKLSLSLLVGCVLAWCGGCVMVLGVESPPKRVHVVSIDGELHIVDLKKKRIRKLDIETMTFDEPAAKSTEDEESN
ncbi:MAG: hypothetical protein ACE5EX_02145 [Phycisphaerae bacterium]